MKADKLISSLIKPLVLSGLYKDEVVALKDIIVNQIENKIKTYNKTIKALQKKYGKDFGSFTVEIENKSTPEFEDDWMEWKGAIEMKKAWDETLKEVLQSEATF